jgi:hypothetical protein
VKDNSAELAGGSLGRDCVGPFSASSSPRRKIVSVTLTGSSDYTVGDAYFLSESGTTSATLLVPVTNVGSGVRCQVSTTAGYSWQNPLGQGIVAQPPTVSVLGSLGESMCSNDISCLAPGETGILAQTVDAQSDIYALVTTVVLPLTGNSTDASGVAWVIPPSGVTLPGYSVLNDGGLHVRVTNARLPNNIGTALWSTGSRYFSRYVLLDDMGLPVGIGTLDQNVTPSNRSMSVGEEGFIEDDPLEATGCGSRVRVFVGFWTRGCD